MFQGEGVLGKNLFKTRKSLIFASNFNFFSIIIILFYQHPSLVASLPLSFFEFLLIWRPGLEFSSLPSIFYPQLPSVFRVVDSRAAGSSGCLRRGLSGGRAFMHLFLSIRILRS